MGTDDQRLALEAALRERKAYYLHRAAHEGYRRALVESHVNSYVRASLSALSVRRKCAWSDELLDALMAGKPPAAHTLFFGAVGLTRRASTRRFYGRATCSRR